MKFCVSVPVYNDKVCLKRLLESTTIFEKVYVIDGRCPFFGDDDLEPLSTDGTRELCNDFDNVELIDMSAPETWKRNIGLEFAAKHGFDNVLTLDSDEYILEFNRSRFTEDCKNKIDDNFHFYGIDEYFNGNIGRNWPKIKHKPWDLEYFVSHIAIRVKTKNIIMKHPIPHNKISGIILSHDDSIRSKEREKMSEKYQKEHLIPYENGMFRIWSKQKNIMDSQKEPI